MAARSSAGVLRQAQSLWVRHRAIGVTGTFILVLAIGWFVDDAKFSFGQMLSGGVQGAATGMLALGLILTYRSDRIINFAYGSMGGVAATVAALLYQVHHVNWGLAVLIGLFTGMAVGALVEFLVIRRFTKASRLILTVATIGLAQVIGGIQLLIPKWIGGGSTLDGGFSTALSAHHVNIGTWTANANDLVVILALPVVIIGLGWFLLRTDTGIAVRAIADNRDRAMLLGLPVRKLSLIVWTLAGLLAAIATTLPAPNGGLTIDAAAGPTLLLPALAAAVIASMESLPVAVAAGIGLGAVDSLIGWNTSKLAVTTVGNFVVILVVLLLNRKRISARDGADETSLAGSGLREIPNVLRNLPEVRAFRIGGPFVLLAIAIVIPIGASQSTINLFSIATIYAMVAVSLVVLSGWSGQVSLGQYAFVGLGACVVGDLMNHYNVDFFVCLAAGGLAGAILAVVVGLPALRIRGFYLAVTTMALAVAMNGFFLNPDNFNSVIPGNIIRPTLWKRFSLQNERPLYYLCLAFLVLFIVIVIGMRQARTGRAIIATRDNERAAAAMAVPTTRVKLIGFVVSGAIAGIAGGLHGTLLQAVGFQTYQPSESFLVFSMLIIGGVDSIGGALLGVMLVELAVHKYPQYSLLITGTGLLVILYILPGGLITVVHKVRDRLLGVVAKRRGIDVTPAAAGAISGDDEADPTGITAIAGGPGGGMLSCSRVHARYGSMQVLFGVDLEVADGEVVALLGTNGAGKSTMLKAIAGLLDPAPGKVWFDGKDISKWSPQQRVQAGLAMMPAKSIFTSLSVAENLRVGGWLAKDRPAELEASRTYVMDLFPQLAERLGQQSGTMSGGQQQMLSLALALLTKPKMLLIDELSLGLAPTVVARLLDVVRELTAQGVTTVIVEQSVNVALEISKRAVFLERGTVRFSGQTSDLLERSDVLRSVFITGAGPDALEAADSGATQQGAAKEEEGTGRRELVDLLLQPTVLECTAIAKAFGGVRVLNDIDFSLHKGEILGLIGHNGAGKTTLFDVVCGFLTPDRGEVKLGGSPITGLMPSERAFLGLGRSFQEARLFPALTVAETIAVALERHLMSKDLVAAALRLPASTISEDLVTARVSELVEQLGLTGYASSPIGELSTGTRRIVELACILAQEPAVVLLDEPTAGVAQRETEALGPLLRKIRDEVGCTMLVIDHDMPLLTKLCDRLLALELGQVIAEGAPSAVLENPRVIESYLGVESATIERSGTTPAPKGPPKKTAAKRAPAKKTAARKTAAAKKAAPKKAAPAKKASSAKR